MVEGRDTKGWGGYQIEEAGRQVGLLGGASEDIGKQGRGLRVEVAERLRGKGRGARAVARWWRPMGRGMKRVRLESVRRKMEVGGRGRDAGI